MGLLYLLLEKFQKASRTRRLIFQSKNFIWLKMCICIGFCISMKSVDAFQLYIALSQDIWKSIRLIISALHASTPVNSVSRWLRLPSIIYWHQTKPKSDCLRGYLGHSFTISYELCCQIPRNVLKFDSRLQMEAICNRRHEFYYPFHIDCSSIHFQDTVPFALQNHSFYLPN